MITATNISEDVVSLLEALSPADPVSTTSEDTTNQVNTDNGEGLDFGAIEEHAEPAQEVTETPQPCIETVQNENASQSQPEAVEAESKAEIPDRVALTAADLARPPQPSLAERVAAELPPPEKAKSVEEALEIPVPTDWQERFTDWNTWAEIPNSEPSTKEIPHHLKVSLRAENRREHAARTWVREVSRTFHNKEGYWYLNDDGRWGLYS